MLEPRPGLNSSRMRVPLHGRVLGGQEPRVAGSLAREGWCPVVCSQRTSPATTLCLLPDEASSAGAPV